MCQYTPTRCMAAVAVRFSAVLSLPARRCQQATMRFVPPSNALTSSSWWARGCHSLGIVTTELHHLNLQGLAVHPRNLGPRQLRRGVLSQLGN